MTTTPPRINARLGAATLRAPAASREDSRPQAILKLHRSGSLDYKARHGLQVNLDVSHKIFTPVRKQKLNKKITRKIIGMVIKNNQSYLNIWMYQKMIMISKKKNNPWLQMMVSSRIF